MPENGLTPLQQICKRSFDIACALLGFIITGWLIVLAYLLARLDTGKNGFFIQKRVGRNGRPFSVIKLRTMKEASGTCTTVTTDSDPRITKIGRILRKLKLDELPQLWNVLKGDMSLVGPRPDVPGFADQLKGTDRIILSVRPGITGPATLRYRNEEELLASVENPEEYNRNVIWPHKVRLNREYVENYSFWKDIYYLWETVSGADASETTSSKPDLHN